MELKVKDLYNLSEGLKEMINKELPTATAFKIQSNAKKIVQELEASDEVKKKVIEKYKESDNEDGSVKLKKDKVVDANQEYTELLEQDVEVDLKQVELSELGEFAKPKTLGLIETIIEE